MPFHKVNGFFVPGKNDLETMLARKRSKEAEVFSQWKDQSRYYNSSLVRAEREKRWTSEGTFQSSMQAFNAQTEEEVADNKVAPRRDKLKQILDDECNQHKILLEAISAEAKDKSSMLVRCTALKQSRDQERAELAKKLLEDHFRKNNADLKKISQKNEEKLTVDAWSEQKELKHQEEEMKKIKALEELAEEEDNLRRREKEEEETQMRRLIEKQEHLKSLQRQLDDIRQREEEAKKLDEEERKLALELNKLEQLEQERQAIEERCKRELHGKALLRQHQAALRRRSAVVQAELQADLEWLAQITGKTNAEDQRRIEKRQNEKDQLAIMRKRIQAELEQERRQEIELDALEPHEAARLWSRREEEWRRETEARQKLLKEVLEGRRAQINQQLEYNRKRQQDELESRESMLEALERAHRGTAEEDLNRLSSKSNHRSELESQIAEKHAIRLEEQKKVDAEEKAEREAELAYEKMLRQEAERLRITDDRKSTNASAFSQPVDASVPLRSKPGGNIW